MDVPRDARMSRNKDVMVRMMYTKYHGSETNENFFKKFKRRICCTVLCAKYQARPSKKQKTKNNMRNAIRNRSKVLMVSGFISGKNKRSVIAVPVESVAAFSEILSPIIATNSNA